jgi:hypothetical protein
MERATWTICLPAERFAEHLGGYLNRVGWGFVNDVGGLLGIGQGALG